MTSIRATQGSRGEVKAVRAIRDIRDIHAGVFARFRLRACPACLIRRSVRGPETVQWGGGRERPLARVVCSRREGFGRDSPPSQHPLQSHLEGAVVRAAEDGRGGSVPPPRHYILLDNSIFLHDADQ